MHPGAGGKSDGKLGAKLGGSLGEHAERLFGQSQAQRFTGVMFGVVGTPITWLIPG